MPLTIKIEDPEEEAKEKRIQGQTTLIARKTLDGNIMILDHDDVDIVIMPAQSKIITFTKGDSNDHTYSTQDRLFNFLKRKGVVLPDTIKSGNVYGSLEASFPATSNFADVLQTILFTVGNFIESEMPYLTAAKEYDEMEDERLLNPPKEDTTELGEVPQEETKGTIIPSYPGYYHGLGSTYRF
tara:strand:+ start:169 stop:720 length:552 start_codon:yes stop_codon:yes gene_type:complete